MGHLRLRGRGQLSLSGCDSRPVYLRLSTDGAAGGEVVCGPYELLEMARARYGCTSCPSATPADATCAAGMVENLARAHWIPQLVEVLAWVGCHGTPHYVGGLPGWGGTPHIVEGLHGGRG
jgi:hypothetical protein